MYDVVHEYKMNPVILIITALVPFLIITGRLRRHDKEESVANPSSLTTNVVISLLSLPLNCVCVLKPRHLWPLTGLIEREGISCFPFLSVHKNTEKLKPN